MTQEPLRFFSSDELIAQYVGINDHPALPLWEEAKSLIDSILTISCYQRILIDIIYANSIAFIEPMQ